MRRLTLEDRVKAGYRYRHVQKNEWTVMNPEGHLYWVITSTDPAFVSCTCPAGQHGHSCKHLKDVFLLEKALGVV